ncbi:MAG: VOC family protein [Gammaproteobacteria bacterium]
MKLDPYIAFDGNCREAFEFYTKVLGAENEGLMTWAEGPHADDMPDDYRDKIMHGSIIVDGERIMGCDPPPGNTYEGIKGINQMISVDTPAEAERIFADLSEGGEITMPMDETFWALRFGMLVDRFGVPWMVNCGKPE